MPVAETVWAAGTVRPGAVVSFTVTLKLFVVELLGVAWSVAVQLTGVVPSGNGPGEAGVQVSVGAGSMSSVAETSEE